MSIAFFIVTATIHYTGWADEALSFWDGHNRLTVVVALLFFGIRDATSPSRYLWGSRICKIEVRFLAASSFWRWVSAFGRSGMFLVFPVWIAGVLGGYLGGMGDEWRPRTMVWSFFVASLLIPISIVLGRGHGIHDVVSRSFVALRGQPEESPGDHPSYRSAIAGVFATIAVAAAIAMAIELASPRIHAQLAHQFGRYAQSMAVELSTAEVRVSHRKVVKITQVPGMVFWSKGPRNLLDESIPASLSDRIASQVLEWAGAAKRIQAPTPLRDGPTLPVGMPYIHVMLLVAREAFEDYFYGLDLVHVCGESLLAANGEFPAVLVSVMRASRIGPQMIVAERRIWVVKDQTGRTRFAPPLEDANRRLLTYQIELGEGPLPTLWGLNHFMSPSRLAEFLDSAQ
jgi:hypothetical protein